MVVEEVEEVVVVLVMLFCWQDGSVDRIPIAAIDKVSLVELSVLFSS